MHGSGRTERTTARGYHADDTDHADPDDTETHPFRVIPTNARAILVWAARCVLRLLNSIRREDRVVMRTECEKIISAIDATEVKYPPLHQCDTLFECVCVCVCCVTLTGGAREY